MKRILRILLFFSVSLFGLVPAHAQWEQIGWQGGTIYPAGQLGNTLYGFGINSVYRSTDWGITWTIFRTGLPLNTIFYNNVGFLRRGKYLYLSFPYLNADSVFYEPGFFYCSEEDSSWSFKKLSLIKGVAPQTLFWSSDTIFAFRQKKLPTIDTDDGFYLSIDGGNTWQLRQTPVPLDKNGFIYSTGSHFLFSINYYSTYYRTDDFGKTWKRLHLPNGDSLELNIAFPTDSDEFIQLFKDANDPPYFYHSTDLGDTWNASQVQLPIGASPGGLPLCESIGNKIFITIDRLYVSSDRGAHFYPIQFADTTLAIEDVLGKDDYYILRTELNGNFSMDSNFDKLSPLISTGVLSNYRALISVSGTRLFALDIISHGNGYNPYYDSLFISTDNGSTWKPRQFFGENKLDNHRWIKDGGYLYATGIQKDSLPCLFRSSDEGESWTIFLNFSTQDVITHCFVQGDSIVIERVSELLFSIDGGLSWISQTKSPIDPASNFYSRNGAVINPLINEYPLIDYTSDFGNTWAEEDVSFTIFTSAYGCYIYGDRWLATYGNSSIFISYYKKSQNSIWSECNGLPSSLICIPSCNENGILYATGYALNLYNSLSTVQGRTALYYSLDSGANWQQWGDYVTNSPDVFIGSDYIFLAGPTELWRGPKPTIQNSVVKSQSTSQVSIGECYPNPASSEMRISYSIPKRSNVVLSVFEITGKEIAQIVKEDHDVGLYETVWDARALPSGSYILKLTACGESATKVVEVVK